MNSTQCPYKTDECKFFFAGRLTLVSVSCRQKENVAYEFVLTSLGVHTVCLAPLTWMVCEMGG